MPHWIRKTLQALGNDYSIPVWRRAAEFSLEELQRNAEKEVIRSIIVHSKVWEVEEYIPFSQTFACKEGVIWPLSKVENIEFLLVDWESLEEK